MTTGEFIGLLKGHYPEGSFDVFDRYMANLDPKVFLLRKQAALIIHEFLYNVLQEPDEEDTDAAFELADIYECRICTMHIAQVYCKGIMSAEGAFELMRPVNEDDAEKFIRRVFCKSERIEYKKIRETFVNAEFDRKKDIGQVLTAKSENTGDNELAVQESIGKQPAGNTIAEGRKNIRIDIRSKAEYDLGHPEDTINIPMDTIVRDPHCVSEDNGIRITIFCNDSDRGRIVEKCLKEAGYSQVSVKFIYEKHM